MRIPFLYIIPERKPFSTPTAKIIRQTKIPPISATRKHTVHATRHCPTTSPAAQPRPSSRLTAATAATHGVYKRINNRNTNAVKGENSVVIDAPDKRTARVLLTLSLAVKP